TTRRRSAARPARFALPTLLFHHHASAFLVARWRAARPAPSHHLAAHLTELSLLHAGQLVLDPDHHAQLGLLDLVFGAQDFVELAAYLILVCLFLFDQPDERFHLAL